MTVFEFLSSSKENMANFVCDRAVIPPCDLVCCNTCLLYTSDAADE